MAYAALPEKLVKPVVAFGPALRQFGALARVIKGGSAHPPASIHGALGIGCEGDVSRDERSGRLYRD
ncbi:hypothetical protein [Pseudoxanthomonas sp.]|jgi:hypothetical protein|uniref:hypothetical protein n=1 Tax=Pseudoxanthomonas sp. TaxID=1871049 RepID=UPI002E123CD8|nr:hypothetical protein [Pseudoxanthomonas sp.]